ncbi:ABC transporter permease [Dyadobacter psychrophilus]|uniref:FtsX-like permease family protein n=1 Tax=Dyadobacter psychrophilus TaxID=651661 RepID=A0A1T5EBT1_9BACT|nr:ABC transporter permease [Dyadobacter psychrophilus]SKB81452.1 FtsX-like permease family protein [Dyadobacter psychrophilus]
MIKNYFKIAIRVLLKQRLYTFLNIGGLALGLTTSLLILLWAKDELSFNTFHPHYEHIARVMLNISSDSQQTQTYDLVAPPIAAAVKREIPGVVDATCSWENKALFTYGEKSNEETGLMADRSFLKVFHFPVLKGNAETALSKPNTILVTKKFAEKYFGKTDPVGKVIRIGQADNCYIEGVLENVPANSSLQFDFIRSMPDSMSTASWVEVKANVFALLAPGVDIEKLRNQMEPIAKRHMPDFISGWSYFPYRLEDWHLRSHFENGRYAGGGRIGYVRLFVVVAIFVLIISAINFTNLSVARAAGRSKEVGIRKAIGAKKSSLVAQFLGESFILTFLAGLISIGLIYVLMPFFNNFFDKKISIDWTKPVYPFGFLAVLVLTSLLAGFYPSFVLSAFKPVLVLKGAGLGNSGRSAWQRKVLIIVQFTSTSILMVGTGVVYQQIEFIKNRNPGYDQKNLVRIEAKDLSDVTHYRQAKTTLSGVPGVEALSSATATFQGTFGRNYVEWMNGQQSEKNMFAVISGDHELTSTLKIKIHAGREFSPLLASDSAGVIINQEAVRRMNLDKPVGRRIRVNGMEMTILGVVENFHIASVHQLIEPTVILFRPYNTRFFFARINQTGRAVTLERLKEKYESLLPGSIFSYQFVDQEYERMYKSEIQVGILANWFSGVAILISCLGLFGLASFSAERRTKEIGIRKVSGASVSEIFILMNKDFVRLVLLSLLLAAYPAWYMMNRWLEKFAYHTSIDKWIFVISAIATISIAVVTVSYQSMKAALADPVKSLRHE